MPFLTGDTLTGSSYLVVVSPDDQLSRAAVIGALVDLCQVYNWETYGLQTAEATADYFCDMLHNAFWTSTPPSTGGGVMDFSQVRLDGSQDAAGTNQVLFDQVDIDTGWWDSDEHAFVAPDDGLYLSIVNMPTVSARVLRTYHTINGAGYELVANNGSVASSSVNGAILLNLTAGDVVRTFLTSSSTNTISGGTNTYPFWQFGRLQ